MLVTVKFAEEPTTGPVAPPSFGKSCQGREDSEEEGLARTRLGIYWGVDHYLQAREPCFTEP